MSYRFLVEVKVRELKKLLSIAGNFFMFFDINVSAVGDK
jgi:hypothetical protein